MKMKSDKKVSLLAFLATPWLVVQPALGRELERRLTTHWPSLLAELPPLRAVLPPPVAMVT